MRQKGMWKFYLKFLITVISVLVALDLYSITMSKDVVIPVLENLGSYVNLVGVAIVLWWLYIFTRFVKSMEY